MKETQRDWVYRVYVTDALKYLAGLNMRYADLFAPEETRTAEEIIDNVRTKLRRLK